jgi:hypothetical protein
MSTSQEEASYILRILEGRVQLVALSGQDKINSSKMGAFIIGKEVGLFVCQINSYIGHVSGHASAVCSASGGGTPAHGNLPADGAPSHCGRTGSDYLDATLPNRWLGRDGPLAWPPSSPDITPLDLFLWDYVKDKFYATKVKGVEGLKARIRVVITTINRCKLAGIWEELKFRLDVFCAIE